MHCCCEVSQSGLEAYPHTGCIPPGFGKTRTHTRRNPYPWARVRVFWGTGAGSPGKPQGYPCQSLTTAHKAILHRLLESNLLSYHAVKKLITNITGVVAVMDDMCINSCHAFTGPFAELEACSICAEPRYDPVQQGCTGKQVPRQQACTILLGPQIQTLQRSAQSTQAMHYQDQKIWEIIDSIGDPVYDDLFSGSDILKLCEDLKLTTDDTTVSFSFDGAQLQQIQ